MNGRANDHPVVRAQERAGELLARDAERIGLRDPDGDELAPSWSRFQQRMRRSRERRA